MRNEPPGGRLPPAIAARDESALAGTRAPRQDAATGEPLPGASVAVDGTSLRTSTDRMGTFTLPLVPAGPQILVVSYLGRADLRQPVTVEADALASVAAALGRPAGFTQEVLVIGTGAIQEGQARALNQQRTAPNIMNIVAADQIGRFPDANAAEAAEASRACRSNAIRARAATCWCAAPRRG